MKRVNGKRARKRRLEHHGTEARTLWFREQPCVCKGLHPACTGGWSEPSHVVSRGAGGTSADIVPMSRGCHQAWHDHGQHTYAQRLTDDCGGEVSPSMSYLDALRSLARTHYATQGPDAPHPGETP